MAWRIFKRALQGYANSDVTVSFEREVTNLWSKILVTFGCNLSLFFVKKTAKTSYCFLDYNLSLSIAFLQVCPLYRGMRGNCICSVLAWEGGWVVSTIWTSTFGDGAKRTAGAQMGTGSLAALLWVWHKQAKQQTVNKSASKVNTLRHKTGMHFHVGIH